MVPNRVVGPRAANFGLSMFESLGKPVRSGAGSSVVAFEGRRVVSQVVSEWDKGQ
jgi:hypothetical protein